MSAHNLNDEGRDKSGKYPLQAYSVEVTEATKNTRRRLYLSIFTIVGVLTLLCFSLTREDNADAGGDETEEISSDGIDTDNKYDDNVEEKDDSPPPSKSYIDKLSTNDQLTFYKDQTISLARIVLPLAVKKKLTDEIASSYINACNCLLYEFRKSKRESSDLSKEEILKKAAAELKEVLRLAYPDYEDAEKNLLTYMKYKPIDLRSQQECDLNTSILAH